MFNVDHLILCENSPSLSVENVSIVQEHPLKDLPNVRGLYSLLLEENPPITKIKSENIDNSSQIYTANNASNIPLTTVIFEEMTNKHCKLNPLINFCK